MIKEAIKSIITVDGIVILVCLLLLILIPIVSRIVNKIKKRK